MSALDPDRTLALTYVPADRRQAVAALWRLDAAMGAVLSGGREPLISQIKLAWWRDSLANLDDAPPPAEPVLQEVAKHVLPLGIKGSQLARMEEGWSILLNETLGPSELDAYSGARGALLFRHSSHLLGIKIHPKVKRAGEGWALADLARHSNPTDAAAALELAREKLSDVAGQRWPRPLRPLGMLAMLARRDVDRGLNAIETQGTPGRMLRMVRHRLTGR